MSLPLEYAHPAENPKGSWLSAACLICAAVCLSLAVNERDGEYYPKSLVLLTAALLMCAVGTLAPRVRQRAFGGAVVRGAVLAAVFAQGLTVLRSTPSGWFYW